MSKTKYAIIGLLLMAVVLTSTQAVTAISYYKGEFNAKYGTSGTRLDTCGICHVNPAGGGPRNLYGAAFQSESVHSSNPALAFSNIEPLDSDGDGYSNIAEITALTFPGDPNDHPTPAPVLTTISVIPSTTSLLIGETQTFTADPRDQNGDPISTTITWSSSNTTVGTIDSAGKFTALAEGSTTITASSGSVSGTASVTVFEQSPTPVLTTITVSPTTTTLAVGGSQDFTATARDQNGNLMSATVTWISGNTTVGTIDSAGKFTALADGSTTVTASSGLVSGTASATVTTQPPSSPPVSGETATVIFVVTDEETGRPIDDAQVTLDGVTKETNDQGKAVFTNVTLGSYSYSVTGEDDEDENQQVNGVVDVTGNTVKQVNMSSNDEHEQEHGYWRGHHRHVRAFERKYLHWAGWASVEHHYD
jgi:hypothetical protein